MEEIIRNVLGPYAHWLMALSFGLVVLKRRTMGRRHIVILLGLTVAAFVGFFAWIVFGLANRGMPPGLFQGVLFALGAVAVGCGSAVGFWFILKSVGLADAPREAASRPRTGPPLQ